MRFLYATLGLLLAGSSALAAGDYTVYPQPQKVTYTGSSFTITPEVNIVASTSVKANTIGRLKEVLDENGLKYTESSAPADGVTDIYIGLYGSGDNADTFLAGSFDSSIFPARSGGYDPHVLRIAPDGDCGAIAILGDSENSAYYACATLQQILEQTNGRDIAALTVEDFAHAKLRGIMEGFYGHPYSIESRINLLDYCKRYKLNFYGYGPKADPYHAGNWRMEYPETVTDEQRNLGQMSADDMRLTAAKAAECNVAFTWIIHPSLGTYYIDLNWVPDIMTKFEHMYDLGIRHFGLSVDDMSGQPSNQNLLASQVQMQIDSKWNTESTPADDRVGGILFTPTAYALNYGGASYVLSTLADVDSKIDVAFTGYDCFSNVRASSFATMADLVKRDPVFWWNNPVNDDYDGFLYLHGLTARWTIEQQGAVPHMKGFLLNPMNQGQASKICLFSGADYAWNPDAFDADRSWQASLYSILKTDEYVEPLRKFIDVVSAYTTKDTTTPEGEKYASLYSDFKNNYPSTSYATAQELYTAMADAYEACAKLRELKNSDDPDLRLFYTDIEPWLLKVEDMTGIVKGTFDMIEGKGDLDHWTDYNSLAERASGIHTAHTFSVLEGSGRTTYETFKEAQPTPTHLDALIDFLASRISGLALQLPQRSRLPEIITNIEPAPAAAALTSDDASGDYTLSGLSATTLKPGEYIGINLNRYQSADISAIQATASSDVVLQHSVNGKSWTDYTPGAEALPLTYFRLRNISRSDATAAADSFTFTPAGESTSSELSISVSTNMPVYSTYAIENVIDGNNSTFFWSDGIPEAGSSYIMIDLGTTATVSGTDFYFNSGDQPSGQCSIEVSSDRVNWQETATFAKADISDRRLSLSFSPIRCRYVRMLINSTTTNEWLQVAEFSVRATVETNGSSMALAVAEDNEGTMIESLDDRRLTTYYQPKGAGSLTYTFTENLNIEEVHVYHNSEFTADADAPKVSIFAAGEWHDLGTLHAVRSKFPTADYTGIEHIRIEWNDANRPVIHEIVPIGTLYVEPAGSISAITAPAVEARAIAIEATGREITVTATADAELTVTVTDTAGRLTARAQGPAPLRLTAPQGIAIVTVTAPGQKPLTAKLLIP